ncbi:MAG: hypothetical protein ACKOC5_05725 [Chloroflexota bacterium]
MDPKLIHSISQEIYRRFPVLAGKRPRVQPFPAPAGRFGRILNPGGPAYLLVYQGYGMTATHQRLPVVVRVTADERGKILKISASR